MWPLTASEEENCHREFSVGDTVALRDNIHEAEGAVCSTYPHGIGTVLPGHVLSDGAQGVVIEVSYDSSDEEPYQVQGEDGKTYWYEAAHLVAGASDDGPHASLATADDGLHPAAVPVMDR